MLITLEGPEGAGKSTAARRIAEVLQPLGREIILTREPGEGDFGAKVRQLLLHEEHLTPWAELSLFLADRAEHCARMIGPANERGAIVICDRFADSTIVYQGYGRGLDLELLRRLNHEATGGIWPDLTLLFDLPVEVGLARLENPDRIDAEGIDFHQRVRDGFLAEAQQEPSRWQVIDAAQSPESVANACVAAIQPLLAAL